MQRPGSLPPSPAARPYKTRGDRLQRAPGIRITYHTVLKFSRLLFRRAPIAFPQGIWRLPVPDDFQPIDAPPVFQFLDNTVRGGVSTADAETADTVGRMRAFLAQPSDGYVVAPFFIGGKCVLKLRATARLCKPIYTVLAGSPGFPGTYNLAV